jgi:hypothetical protein
MPKPVRETQEIDFVDGAQHLGHRSLDNLVLQGRYAEGPLATIRFRDVHPPDRLRVITPRLIAIFGWLAQQERERLIERTKAGLERARRQGRRIGRPRAHVDVAKALALRGEGKSIRQAASVLGVGAATLHRALRTHEDALELAP